MFSGRRSCLQLLPAPSPRIQPRSDATCICLPPNVSWILSLLYRGLARQKIFPRHNRVGNHDPTLHTMERYSVCLVPCWPTRQHRFCRAMSESVVLRFNPELNSGDERKCPRGGFGFCRRTMSFLHSVRQFAPKTEASVTTVCKSLVV